MPILSAVESFHKALKSDDQGVNMHEDLKYDLFGSPELSHRKFKLYIKMLVLMNEFTNQ